MISSTLIQLAPSRSGIPFNTVAASLATISDPAMSFPMAPDPEVGVGCTSCRIDAVAPMITVLPRTSEARKSPS